MPEGDTIFRVARSMHRALAGQVLLRTDFRVAAHATASLAGQVVREVVPVGKHLLLRTDGGLTLHSHLRMDGSWVLYRAGDRWDAGPGHQIRVALETASWAAVGYRLPVVDLLPTAEEAQVVGHLGPDILQPTLALDVVLQRLERVPSRSVAEAILDQRNLAGIGNVYKNEVLFLQGLDPWTPVGEVPDLAALVLRARRLMLGNLDSAERTTTGRRGRGQRTWVDERAGLPCWRCGAAILTALQGGDLTQARRTWWCPRCQPGGWAPPL